MFEGKLLLVFFLICINFKVYIGCIRKCENFLDQRWDGGGVGVKFEFIFIENEEMKLELVFEKQVWNCDKNRL